MNTEKKSTQQLYRIVIASLWMGIIVFCVINRSMFSIEGISNASLGNMTLTFCLLMLLFALKGMSIVIHSGILFVACGMLFPTRFAIPIALCGAIVMFSVPYIFGKIVGADIVDELIAKKPKAALLKNLNNGNDIIFSFLARIISILPIDLVSAYMGSIKIDYRKYIIGSLLGITPQILIYVIAGDNATTPGSPEFLICLVLGVVFIIASTVLFYVLWKKAKQPQ